MCSPEMFLLSKGFTEIKFEMFLSSIKFSIKSIKFSLCSASYNRHSLYNLNLTFNILFQDDDDDDGGRRGPRATQRG